MAKDVFTFLVGGKAGEGVKKAGSVAAGMFASLDRNVFQMDEYESLIKGGHNYSVVSTSVRELSSHYTHADIVVALDKRSYGYHEKDVAPGGIVVYNSDAMGTGQWNGVGVPFVSLAKGIPKPELHYGAGAVAVLAAALGMDRKELVSMIRTEYSKDVENNVAYASAIFDAAVPLLGAKFKLGKGKRHLPVMGGSEALALGACLGGLDIYFGYPMTPSSTLLHFLASRAKLLGVTVMHPESEVAVANMAIGATFTGARAMLGTSGGGFGLMVEAFSLAGMAESPLLCFYAQRSGPSTGGATLHEQSDLNFVISAGHGEFPRLVASPGDMAEALLLASEMMELVWKFQTPGILLSEKHLAESSMSTEVDITKAKWSEPLMHKDGPYARYRITDSGVSPLLFPPSKQFTKWTSHEHLESGIYSEKSETLIAMHDKRRRKGESLVEHLKKMHTVNVFGNGGPFIMTYGSTTMMVREALRAGGIAATVVQPIYLEPFPSWEMEKYRGKSAVVVEQSSTGVFARFLKEKAGIESKAVVKKYDGHPFDPDELATMLKGVL